MSALSISVHSEESVKMQVGCLALKYSEKKVFCQVDKVRREEMAWIKQEYYAK